MDNPTKRILVSREKIISVPVDPVNNSTSKKLVSQKTLFYIIIFIIIAFLLFK
jgi:hypothetical protein